MSFEQKAQAVLDAALDAPTTPYGLAAVQVDLANVVRAQAVELDRLSCELARFAAERKAS